MGQIETTPGEQSASNALAAKVAPLGGDLGQQIANLSVPSIPSFANDDAPATAVAESAPAAVVAGAGVVGHLPLSRFVLPAICAVYLGRAVAFPLLKPAFPENSQMFWLVSSGICLVIG